MRPATRGMEGMATNAADEEMLAFGLRPAGQVFSDRLDHERRERDDALLDSLAAHEQLRVLRVEVAEGDSGDFAPPQPGEQQ